MSAPFTAGPWEVVRRPKATDDQFDIMPVAAGGMGWVTLPHQCPKGVGDYMQVGGGCNEATATLISAAPDLLEACKKARAYMFGAIGNGHPTLDVLEAAIAKAERRS